MAVHITSNDSLHHLNFSSVSQDLNSSCFIKRPSSDIYLTFFITNILLLLPLSILTLSHGLRQCQSSTSNFRAVMLNPSDCFTYHVTVMELICIGGFVALCFGIYLTNDSLLTWGAYPWTYTWYGEAFFHLLTCVERYLAVVHPIIYVSLKSKRGLRIRIACHGCTWLICSVLTYINTFDEFYSGIQMFLYSASLIITVLLSLSVLRVLIRPGPGEQGTDRERVDQLKQKAFITMMAILGVLLLRFLWSMSQSVLLILKDPPCMIMSLGIWLNLPCSMALPLMYVHRAGLLYHCRNTE